MVSAGRFPWRAAGWLLLALVLDDKLTPHLSVTGGGLLVPDFTRVALMWVSLTHSLRFAAWSGFTAGVLLDVAVPEAMGARALSLTVAGYGVARIAGEVDGFRLPVHVIVLTAMGFVDCFLFRVARHLTEPVTGLGLLGRDLLELVPTAVVAAVVLIVAGQRRRIPSVLRRGAPS